MSAPTVFGICMVRDEADIVGFTLLHHLALGLDCALVLDNGSTDGTHRVLDRLRAAGRVHVRRDERAFRPGEIATALAREAHAEGATWVVPFDADEFWDVPGSNLPAWLDRFDADAIEVPVVNYVQRRDQHVSSAEGLLHATYRVAEPVGPIEVCEALVEARRISYVEILYPTKWASRASGTIHYAAGYHAVSGAGGRKAAGEGATIRHLPLRSRQALHAKAGQGRRVMEAGFEGGDFWHSRRFHRLREEGALEAEWAANSHREGVLDVYGDAHPLMYDPRLRALVEPLVRDDRPVSLLSDALRRWLSSLWAFGDASR
jgi:Glycosyl transferase family 2